jgi:cytochrome c
MVRYVLAIVLFAFALAGGQFNAVAADRGTPDEAKAMVDRAVALIAKEGNEKAYAVISENPGPFVDRDLYVSIVNFDGVSMAHGANKGMIGKTLIGLKDSSGRAFVQEYLDIAKAKGEGSIEYDWPNPVTKKIETKSAYFKKIGDVVVLVGTYKP